MNPYKYSTTFYGVLHPEDLEVIMIFKTEKSAQTTVDELNHDNECNDFKVVELSINNDFVIEKANILKAQAKTEKKRR